MAKQGISTCSMLNDDACAVARYEAKVTLAPSAGPTGGAGFALPAWSANLIKPVTAKSLNVNTDCLDVC